MINSLSTINLAEIEYHFVNRIDLNSLIPRYMCIYVVSLIWGLECSSYFNVILNVTFMMIYNVITVRLKTLF